MSLELSDVSKDELHDVVGMLLKAYDGNSSFVNAVYPHQITDHGVEGLDMVVARLRYLYDIDPSIKWFKVTDTSTGEIVSASQWNIYDKEKPPEMMLDGPPGAWATESDKKYAIEMFEAFIAPRHARYRAVDTPIVCLNIMGTAKRYQHHGAAMLQVQEGTRVADNLNALITTESTTEARWLYERNGFVVSEQPGHWIIEPKSPEFTTKPKERLFFMERPRVE